MHYIFWSKVLCTTLFVSTLHAAPKPSQKDDKVHRALNTNAHMKNGVVAFRKSYQKYGWKLPHDVSEGLKDSTGVETNSKVATSDGSDPSSEPAKGHGGGTGKVDTFLANENSEYLCPVTIGGQTLHMNLDTGSSDL